MCTSKTILEIEKKLKIKINHNSTTQEKTLTVERIKLVSSLKGTAKMSQA
jgi:hypothetical protein